MVETFKSRDGHFVAVVSDKFLPCGVWDGTYSVSFFAFGSPDFDVRGTFGTGYKSYETKAKAISAAKRYIRKYEVL